MIDLQEYKNRRLQLAKKMEKDAIAIIPSANEVIRNGDVHFRFRQDSDFSYLTGFNEPNCLLLVMGETGESILFNRPSDPIAETWNGKRLGQDGVRELLGIEYAYSITTLDLRLTEFLAQKKSIYFFLDRHPALQDKILAACQSLRGAVRRGVSAPEVFQDLAPILGEMRLFKSKSEITNIQKAIDISIKAHINAMRACRPGVSEYELEAILLYEFRRGGCEDIAYVPIVAGGAQACTLHYTENNKLLKNNELVLIDAGGEYKYYAADITRTFPVNGRFSAEQKLIYDLVLSAQKEAIDYIKPGVHWNEMQEKIIKILTQGLIDLEIIKGSLEDAITHEAYKPFYMHQSGHWLGMDVHDVGNYKINGQWRPLEENMVFTVEPGLYIKRDPSIDSRWWDIGVRIEDDILVTHDGHKNLSAALPVLAHKIEALIGS